MARQSKGKFTMKGHTLPGIKQIPGKTGDGRATSSPFQMEATGDSPNKIFGLAKSKWYDPIGVRGLFGIGKDGSPNNNPNNTQVGTSYERNNFQDLQNNVQVDSNITQPGATQATNTQVVPNPPPPVNNELAVAETGNPPLTMKSPVKNYKKGYYKTPLEAGPEIKQFDVDDIDPFSDEETAYENAQNDYNTDNPTKEQLAIALRKVELENRSNKSIEAYEKRKAERKADY